MGLLWHKVQVTIPHSNGLPEDAVTNTWHYYGNDVFDRTTNAIGFEVQLDAFYTSWVPGYGSTQYVWDEMSTKHFDFLDEQPRLPFYESTLSPGVPTGTKYDLPAEVAICLSMEGPRASGVNMRRRRGRVYLGPLQVGAFDYAYLSDSEADFFATAAESAFFGDDPQLLAIYSPYTHHGVPVGDNIKDHPDEIPDFLPASFSEVVKVWVDTAFDTQRRRGPGATYRKTITK